jgi:hypothetical protein
MLRKWEWKHGGSTAASAIILATEVLGWPKICKLACAFRWEYSYKVLKLAQLLGQHGVFLTNGWQGLAGPPPRCGSRA